MEVENQELFMEELAKAEGLLQDAVGCLRLARDQNKRAVLAGREPRLEVELDRLFQEIHFLSRIAAKLRAVIRGNAQC